MFVSTSEFLGVLSVLAHVVCRLAGVLVTCQIMLKTPILRTDDPSSQHRVLSASLSTSKHNLIPCLLCWLLRISVPKNASPMARTEFFLAPSSLWEDGNGAAHVAVYYLVFERISEVASTAAHNR